MNLLAHAYLSFSDADVLTGNMISDFVKGRKQYDLPVTIQRGIQLHRAIDTFTDTHETTKELKKFFAPAYRLYSGAFTDVVHDYFLANDQSIFPSEKALKAFTEKTYLQLQQNKNHFGEQFGFMFPYMKEQNWLFNYRFPSGIQKSFGGLRKRSRYIKETDTAFAIFEKNIPAMQYYYDIFFPELKIFTLKKLENLYAPGGLSLEQSKNSDH